VVFAILNVAGTYCQSLLAPAFWVERERDSQVSSLSDKLWCLEGRYRHRGKRANQVPEVVYGQALFTESVPPTTYDMEMDVR